MLNNSSKKYFNNEDNNPAALIQDYSSSEVENKFRYETIIQTDKPWKIEFGIDGAQAKYTNNTFQQLYIQDTVLPVEFNSKLTFYRYGAFGQYSHKLFDSRLSLSLGIRIDGNTYNKDMSNPFSQFSPRFSASYQLTEQISLSASTGRFYQLPGYTSLGFRDAKGVLVNKNNNIRYMAVNHLVGGIEYQPTGDLRITGELFYKAYERNLFSLNDSISLAHRPIDFGSVGSEPVSSTNNGRAYGAEVLMQYKLSSKTGLVLSYTYAISEYEDKNGKLTPSSWDNRHIFIISGNHKLKGNWSVAAKWRYAGGLPYTPYDLASSANIAAWDVQGRPYSDYTKLNSERFKAFHQLDIRIDKTYNFKKSSLKLYVDIQNLYNFKSQDLDRITNLNEQGVAVIDPANPSKYVLRTIPSDGSGTILPTIGVIFDF
jgi:outer membrane receptor for ferrienterochelin and colicin